MRNNSKKYNMYKQPLTESEQNNDFFDEVDDNDVFASDEEVQKAINPDNIKNLSVYDYYISIDYYIRQRNDDYNDNDYTVRPKHIYDGLEQILDTLPLLNDFYIDEPILYDEGHHFTTQKLPFPLPSVFDFSPLYAETNRRYYIYERRPKIYYRIFFYKKDINKLSFERYMRFIAEFQTKLNNLFNKGRYGYIGDIKFYKNTLSTEELNTFKDNAIPQAELISGTISDSSMRFANNMDQVYINLFDADLPAGHDMYDRDNKRNFYRDFLINKVSNISKALEITQKVSEQRFNIRLTVDAIQPKPTEFKSAYTSDNWGAYIAFTADTTDGSSTIDTLDLEQCLIACFFNNLAIQMLDFCTTIISVKPGNCEFINNSPLKGEGRFYKKMYFKNTPKEVTVQNVDYTIESRKKIKCQSWDDNAVYDDKTDEYYRTVSDTTKKLSTTIRELNYKYAGISERNIIVFLDKKGMWQRNAMKCSFYTKHILKYFIREVLPKIYKYTLKDESK